MQRSTKRRLRAAGVATCAQGKAVQLLTPRESRDEPRNFLMFTKREIVTLDSVMDAPQTVRSLVIPLPRNRALRIGFRLTGWCELGPRRYRVVASPDFAKSLDTVLGEDGKGKELLDQLEIPVQGDLKAVEDDLPPAA
jgi:hypothetical protein